jgi:hypothetical protein
VPSISAINKPRPSSYAAWKWRQNGGQTSLSTYLPLSAASREREGPSDTNNALQDDFVAFVMNGTPMPPSSYPMLGNGQLVPATQKAEGFPDLSDYPFHGNQINHVELYNFGPEIDYHDQTGIITIQPPNVDQCCRPMR